MKDYILSHLTSVKSISLVIASAIAGIIIDAIETAAKYPALIAALAGASVALLIKLIDVWYEKKKEKRNSLIERTASADKVLEIETQEKRDLRIALNALRAEEKQLADEKLAIARAESFEARQRAHRFGNEVTKLQSLILGLQNTMHAHNLVIPEITFTPYHDLMFGSKEEQAALEERRSALTERMKIESDKTRSFG